VLKSAIGQARPLARGSTIKGVILLLAQALPIMAVVSLFPVIPKLAAQFGSASNAAYLVPMIITLPSLGIAIFSPAAGWLTDRFGRRPVFIASLALYAVAGLAPLWLTHIRPIVVSRAILGVAEAGVVTVASTLIAD
jgi:MFS family permease